jgi:hypothetical protein
MLNETTTAICDNEPVATLNFKLRRDLGGRMFMEATNAREVVSANTGRAIRTSVDLIRVSQNTHKTAWEIRCYTVTPHESGLDCLQKIEETDESANCVSPDFNHPGWNTCGVIYKRAQFKSRFSAMAEANQKCEADFNNYEDDHMNCYNTINSQGFCGV